ncbi:MAG: hypothetical protein CM1200mP2_55490 [Planctomycetaceae bacterium]|nr:MAG: hypothetical protein CM1200mP2_55490 [Planctomycetaceae bacterium]
MSIVFPGAVTLNNFQGTSNASSISNVQVVDPGGCLVGGKGTEVARRAVRIDPVQPVADVDEWRTVP